MASGVVWDGLAEYLDELKKLPDDCLGEATKLIEGEVNAAHVRVATVYNAHRYAGYLANHLRITPLRTSGRFVAGLELKSDSPHAWLFDNGSQARHYTGTDKLGRVFNNADRGKMWGRSAPTHIFSRTVGFARRRLAQQYREMLLRRGAASVTGE